MKLNKYICLFVCILCATTTSFAKKNKTSEKVEQTVAEEVVEETTTEEVAAEEAPAVETPAEASEVSAEEVAAEPAPAEETVADATATEEVAEASEDAVEESEEVSDDDDEEVVEKKSKKKKKKSKKKKSKKKKKKKHYDDDDEESSDEDFESIRFGFHAGLASNVSVISTRGNATLDLGLGFAYFFTPNIGVVTGADLGIGYAQYKIPGYLYAYGYYESNVRSVVFSVDVPVKVRYAINSDFWVEAGTGLYVSVYGYTHSSNDFNSQDTYSSTISAGVRNYTIGGGMNLGSIGLGAEVGYVSGGWTLGINLYTGL